jgi:arabinofuranosyltransferase
MFRGKEKTWFVICAGLILSGLLVLHAIYYVPFLSDDALISLRYANRLLQGRGLTWTEGRPVEGYSNLLWILLTAGLGALGVDLIHAVRILGLIGMGLVMVWVLLWYTRQHALRDIWLPLVAGLLFFCLAGPTAVWAVGGMEQPLYAALLGLAIPLGFVVMESNRSPTGKALSLSLILGLVSITRPDGPIFTVAAVLSIMIAARLRSGGWFPRAVFLILAFPVLFYSGQTVFRFFYYGELVPNTALVKLSFSMHHLFQGMEYVAQGMLALAPFSMLAVISIVGLLRSPQVRQRGVLLLAMLTLWLLYIALVGGDVFPAWRHLVPVVVIFTFALIEGGNLAWEYAKRSPRLRQPQLYMGLMVLLAVYLGIQFTNPENRRAINERWEWNGKVIGLLLKKAFAKEQPLLAVTAAGCLPYWSELPCLDMLGLNDYYLPRHLPEQQGRGVPGHGLGNGRYVLDSRPDIVCFHTGQRRPVFRSGHQMWQTNEFHQLYTPVEFRGTYPHEFVATLWIRRYSPKIGIRQTDSQILVPGFLLNDNPETVAYLNQNDEPVVAVASGQHAGIVIPSLSTGDWRIEVKTPHPEHIHSRLERRGGAARMVVTCSSPQPVEISEIRLTRPE